MSLIEWLEKQTKWHERQTWDNAGTYDDPESGYSLADEDLRALLQEAADRIKGLSLIIERQRDHIHDWRRNLP